MKFRNLRADEIDVRVAQVKANGCMLLLYKDARCDMNILDEVVGTMNWQRSHTRDNANCIVSIWDSEKLQWISKEDTGTESNTEKAKGQASDSFKRACFNWGIGRELYTAPFIWVDAKNVNINGGKTYDKFQVDAINVEKGVITDLTIYNKSKKCIAFEMGKSQNNSPSPLPQQKPKLTPQQYVAAKKKEKNVADDEFFGYIKEIIGKNNLADCTKEDCTEIYKWLETQ